MEKCILTTNLKKEIKKNVSDKHELELNFNKKDSERREVGLLHVYYKRLEERDGPRDVMFS